FFRTASITAAKFRSSNRSLPRSAPTRWCIRFCSPTKICPAMAVASVVDVHASAWEAAESDFPGAAEADGGVVVLADPAAGEAVAAIRRLIAVMVRRLSNA